MIIGIGCDIVSLQRVEDALQHPGFLRILTKEEEAIYLTLPKTRQIEWLAGRFAAKEAIIKAISVKEKKLLSDLTIGYDDKRPCCYIEGYKVHVSIAHEQSHAIAYACVESEESYENI